MTAPTRPDAAEVERVTAQRIAHRQRSNGCHQHEAGADGMACCEDCWCAYEAAEGVVMAASAAEGG